MELADLPLSLKEELDVHAAQLYGATLHTQHVIRNESFTEKQGDIPLDHHLHFSERDVWRLAQSLGS